MCCGFLYELNAMKLYPLQNHAGAAKDRLMDEELASSDASWQHPFAFENAHASDLGADACCCRRSKVAS